MNASAAGRGRGLRLKAGDLPAQQRHDLEHSGERVLEAFDRHLMKGDTFAVPRRGEPTASATARACAAGGCERRRPATTRSD
jgi:hypothetical protein